MQDLGTKPNRPLGSIRKGCKRAEHGADAAPEPENDRISSNKPVHYLLCLLLDKLHVGLVYEAFRIDLVDIFRT